MEVLWIEDNPKLDELKQVMFTDSGLFNNNVNNIIIPKSFDETWYFIENEYNQFDYVVIDIDLINFEIGNKGEQLLKKFQLETEDEFKKEAGFHLYLQLLKKGFKNNRIIFLTGNASGKEMKSLGEQFQQTQKSGDKNKLGNILNKMQRIVPNDQWEKLSDFIEDGNIDKVLSYWEELSTDYEGTEVNNTYGKYENRFNKARLDPARAIPKDFNDRFHDWLKERIDQNIARKNKAVDFDYITLRRGIIKGCDYIQKKIESLSENKDNKQSVKTLDGLGKIYNPIKNFIAYNDTCAEKKDEITIDQVTDFLTKLKDFLPLYSPNNKEPLYYRFIRELSSIWDIKIKRKKSRNGNYTKINFQNFCPNQMKLLRNWAAHDQLSKNLSEKEVAYYFICGIRALVKLDINKVFSHEILLSQLFNNTHNIDKNKLKKLLYRAYIEIQNHSERFYMGPKEFFNYILREFGKYNDNQENRKHSIKLFYQNFWFAFTKAKIKELNKQKNKYEIYLYPPDVDSKKFTGFLGKMIYNESF